MILATKLYVPQPPPRSVQRARLIERLDEGRDRRLTLVSAPAGFGKTTALTTWVAGAGQTVHAVSRVAPSLEDVFLDVVERAEA